MAIHANNKQKILCRQHTLLSRYSNHLDYFCFFVLLILLIYSCKLILLHMPLFLSCCDGYGVQWIEPEFSAKIIGIVSGLYEDSRYKSA